MALRVGLLLLWVCQLHSVIGPDYEGSGIVLFLSFCLWLISLSLMSSTSIQTIIHFPEVKDGECFFPLHYKNEIFYDCVKFTTKHKWCSLNETYQGYWKYCSEDDFAKCVFPFWYRHMIYRECTEDGDAFGKKWCSLTQHYNKDKMWKYCD
ncbi:LOW QUALITY PROTEIN: binder of sperm protein homolog 1 [Ursus americanus]|uniref:LOW QUALITY PROTEIN: binder of sperm protein homolog 1 n=1 Tax=Ursus americanus TaxID=9643 RepID=UPI001E67A040|nr:LOW QUALITY PROTEIN: binder of sperm protein homolog 1 [Ursus americanus]